MAAKKILIVSHAFYPMITPRAFRATELCKEFARQGHDITVITHAHKEQDALVEEFGFKIIDLGKKPEDIKINPKTSKFHPFRVFRKIMITFFEYPEILLMSMVRKKLKGMSDFDLMISFAVPHPVHWGVAQVHNTNNKIAKKWIADCGDPFMLVPYATGLNRKMFYFKSFEKSFCREADFVTIPNKAMKQNFYPEFKDKMRELPQGFKFEDTKKHLKEYKKNSVPTFVFAGSFYPEIRDPREFLEILLSQDKDFRFHVYTQNTILLQPFLEELGDRLVIHEYIPRDELIGVLSQMDFLVNIGYNPAVQLPSKLIDYYLTDRPILNLPKKGLNKDIIIKFLDGNYEDKFQHPDIDQYKIENISRRFLELE